MAFGLIVGIPLGIMAAIKRGKGADYFSVLVSVIGISVPFRYSGNVTAICSKYS